MRLFDTPGADAAYDRWLDPPDEHEEDGCEKCHEYHREEGIIEEACEACIEEKCEACGGSGWREEYECWICEATGRLSDRRRRVLEQAATEKILEEARRKVA